MRGGSQAWTTCCRSSFDISADGRKLLLTKKRCVEIWSIVDGVMEARVRYRGGDEEAPFEHTALPCGGFAMGTFHKPALAKDVSVLCSCNPDGAVITHPHWSSVDCISAPTKARRRLFGTPSGLLAVHFTHLCTTVEHTSHGDACAREQFASQHEARSPPAWGTPLTHDPQWKVLQGLRAPPWNQVDDRRDNLCPHTTVVGHFTKFSPRRRAWLSVCAFAQIKKNV